jgi:peptidoglycan-associated lipoprotein
LFKKISGILLLAFAVACSSTSGTQTTASDSSSGTSTAGSDPGLTATHAATTSDEGLSTIYFDYDQAALRGDAREALKQNAEFLKQNPDVSIEIQGNCDERGSSEYNLALGMRRAESARRYLMDMGVEQKRISTISFGEEKPVIRGTSEQAWSKNRRGDFVAMR